MAEEANSGGWVLGALNVIRKSGAISESISAPRRIQLRNYRKNLIT
jgi:hypothetical protein